MTVIDALHHLQSLVSDPVADKRRLVCFTSSFRHESALNISHATLDGERTLCGRTDWMTEDPWADIGPDCLRCSASLEKRT